MYSDTPGEVKLSLISIHRTWDYTSTTIATNITTTMVLIKSSTSSSYYLYISYLNLLCTSFKRFVIVIGFLINISSIME